MAAVGLIGAMVAAWSEPIRNARAAGAFAALGFAGNPIVWGTQSRRKFLLSMRFVATLIYCVVFRPKDVLASHRRRAGAAHHHLGIFVIPAIFFRTQLQNVGEVFCSGSRALIPYSLYYICVKNRAFLGPIEPLAGFITHFLRSEYGRSLWAARTDNTIFGLAQRFSRLQYFPRDRLGHGGWPWTHSRGVRPNGTQKSKPLSQLLAF